MIMVTGATGFIGSHLLAGLARAGHEVIGVSRHPQRDEGVFLLRTCPPVEIIHIDRMRGDQVGAFVGKHKPDVIVHLDANVNPPGLERNPGKAIRANFLTTVDWLTASATNGVRRFIFASSIGVLPRVQYQPIDENHPLVLANEGSGSGFYGASKGASELFGLSFRKSYGIEFTSVRSSAVFGFGMQWPIGIKPVVEAAVEGHRVSVPRFGPPRDYTPVGLAVDVFAAAATLDEAPPGIVYAATGGPLVSVSDLNKIFSEVFPKAEIEVTDENTDPGEIESLYRGVIDMSGTMAALNLAPPQDSLATQLGEYATTHQDFLDWRSQQAR